eukprot:TRINITY_DN23028_c0_g2_i1.p1 TRINITY_DN23028_c0_g2~~TRINITY_DN23028_c0_g2_i1.p1  ORF type:complete len:114 (+),score=13.05 TRINITY_DN23028_c0_g2_i1:44-385(+)
MLTAINAMNKNKIPLECSKDTAYMLQYLDKRFEGIEKELKVHYALLERLACFYEKSLKNSSFNTVNQNCTCLKSQLDTSYIHTADTTKSDIKEKSQVCELKKKPEPFYKYHKS